MKKSRRKKSSSCQLASVAHTLIRMKNGSWRLNVWNARKCSRHITTMVDYLTTHAAWDAILAGCFTKWMLLVGLPTMWSLDCKYCIKKRRRRNSILFSFFFFNIHIMFCLWMAWLKFYNNLAIKNFK